MVKEVVQKVTFCSFEKDQLSKILILIKLLFSKKKKKREREKNRLISKIHFSKEIPKLHFSKLFVWTMSGLDPLWERYVGNLFKGPITITHKETSFQKRFFKIAFFITFFWTTFGPDPLWERYVGSLSKGLVTITQTFFQRLKIKTFLCVNLG